MTQHRRKQIPNASPNSLVRVFGVGNGEQLVQHLIAMIEDDEDIEDSDARTRKQGNS